MSSTLSWRYPASHSSELHRAARSSTQVQRTWMISYSRQTSYSCKAADVRVAYRWFYVVQTHLKEQQLLCCLSRECTSLSGLRDILEQDHSRLWKSSGISCTLFYTSREECVPVSEAVWQGLSYQLHRQIWLLHDSLAEFSPISVTNMFIKSFLGKKGPRKGLRASTQPQGCLLKWSSKKNRIQIRYIGQKWLRFSKFAQKQPF